MRRTEGRVSEALGHGRLEQQYLALLDFFKFTQAIAETLNLICRNLELERLLNIY
jgi:hypothetical protein